MNQHTCRSSCERCQPDSIRCRASIVKHRRDIKGQADERSWQAMQAFFDEIFA